MTDGDQNSNDFSDEDWAMSEPEIPLVKPKPATPVDEAAAKLYAPPESGDLDDWDITDERVSNAPAAAGKPPQTPPAPDAFVPPPQSFEVLKPIAPVHSDGTDWGMSPPSSDGWKMPEPVFRVSDGEILTRLGKRPASRKADPEPEINENLSGIYEPPPTEESSDLLGEFESSEEVSGRIDPVEPAVERSQTAMPAAAQSNQKSKGLSWLVWGLAAAGLFLVALILGTFFVFYYGMLGFRR